MPMSPNWWLLITGAVAVFVSARTHLGWVRGGGDEGDACPPLDEVPWIDRTGAYREGDR